MKSAVILSSLALALPAFAAPAPSATPIRDSLPCPSANGKVLTSNNNAGYTISCKSDISSSTIRVTDTEVGIQGCLTACDGTTGCNAVTFVPSNKSQSKGKCYSKGAGGKIESAAAGTAVAIPVKPKTSPTSSVASSTATASATASATSTSDAPTGPWAGLSIRSGSEIQYASISANGSAFWLFKDSGVYCPPSVSCSNTTTTLFASGTNTLFLDVAVPGGQQVYVASDGALKFTVPHSAYTGTGSLTTGFGFAEQGSHLQFNGSDWLACPSGNAYQVYAAAVTGAKTGCEGFAFRVALDSQTPAFEYV